MTGNKIIFLMGVGASIAMTFFVLAVFISNQA